MSHVRLPRCVSRCLSLIDPRTKIYAAWYLIESVGCMGELLSVLSAAGAWSCQLLFICIIRCMSRRCNTFTRPGLYGLWGLNSMFQTASVRTESCCNWHLAWHASLNGKPVLRYYAATFRASSLSRSRTDCKWIFDYSLQGMSDVALWVLRL